MWALGRALFFVGLAAALVRADDEEIPFEEMNDLPMAQLTEPQLKALFGRIDGNADELLSTGEIHAFAADMRKRRAKEVASDEFKEYDENKDGKVTLEEVQRRDAGTEEDADMAKHWANSEMLKFKAADEDGNGFLSEQELAHFVHPSAHEGVEEAAALADLQRKDTDGSGKLSIDEFYELQASDESLADEESDRFNGVDKDHDGELDLQELKAWESGRYHVEESMERLVARADADGDGRLSLQELLLGAPELADQDAGFHMEDWVSSLEL